MKKRILNPALQILALMIVLLSLSLSACKKKNDLGAGSTGNGSDSTNANGNTALSDEDSLKFYVWAYTVPADTVNIPYYYWYDQVPAINPFDKTYPDADSLLSAIKSYPMYEGKKVDRYSFLDRTGSVADQLQGGIAGDFGWDVGAVSDSAGPIIYITYAYDASPAGLAGIQRGWYIKSVNGNADMSLGGANETRIVNAIYYSSSATFTFGRGKGISDTTLTLNAATYHIDPILADSVYNWNNEKVGYFVYNSFINVSGTEAAAITAKSEIDNVFTKFKTAGVQDLIVDLRYNGGGSVPSAEYLDDLIAPGEANGQTMYQSKYNDQLTAYFQSDAQTQKDFLDPVKYQLASLDLNLKRIFFIVDQGTASASELTINNLRPYMDVYLVGHTTYGKPVGFLQIPISFVSDSSHTLAHVADLYAINFETVNKNNQGQYFNGMTPDQDEPDYVDLNWGNINDARLKAIHSFITNGSFATSTARLANRDLMKRMINSPVHRKKPFRGMVDNRFNKLFNNNQFLRKHH